jgi:rod shape-determining protein MreC
MREIWSRIKDFVILAGLILISVTVMINRNDEGLRVLRAASLELTSRVEERFAWVGHYVGALAENDALRRDNVSLSGELALLRQAGLENQRLQSMLGVQDSVGFDLVAAKIIDKDITRQKNTLSLDVGRRDGVEAGMAVVDENGILGKVIFVSDRFAVAQSYFNTDFRIPAQLMPENTFGIVRWEGRGRFSHLLLLEHIVKTVDVEPGQQIVTSHSISFPSGIAIGSVDTVLAQPGRDELRIYLRPASPIGPARYAFVVKALPDEELIELQAQAPP